MAAANVPSISINMPINAIGKSTEIKTYLFRQLFLEQKNPTDPNLLTKIGDLYNCNIVHTETTHLSSQGNNIKSINLTITPHDCNYFIHVKHTPLSPDKTSVSFRLSLKKEGTTIDNYEPGFTSQYFIEKGNIYHVYDNPELIPFKSRKIKTTLSDKIYTTIFNPYIKFNEILRTQQSKFRIIHTTPLQEINESINTINVKVLSLDQKKDLEKITQIFLNHNSKRAYDDKLRELLPYSFRRKAQNIEQLEEHYKRNILYETNLPINNMLGNRYAQYYPDFKFNKITKSTRLAKPLPIQEILSNDKIKMLMEEEARNNPSSPNLKSREIFIKSLKYNFLNFEHINYIRFGLNRPFNITDLYFYKFPSFSYVDNRIRIVHKIHPHNMEARDCFKLNDEKNISRAFDLIELSKSLIFTFLSVYNSTIQGVSSVDNQKIIDLPFRIFNVYPKLPWASNILDTKNNMILAILNYLRTLKINIQKVGTNISLTVNMKNENKLHKDVSADGKYNTRAEYFMPCHEAPFKLFEGIIREPFMSINNLSGERSVYELRTIPEYSDSDGLEGKLIVDPNANERLNNHKDFHFDGLRHLNEQLRLININSDDNILEEEEQNKSIDFELSDMSELFPEMIVEKHEQTQYDDKLQKIRDESRQRREITLRLAKEQAERDAIEEATRLSEEEALREREEARDAADIEYHATNSAFEPEPYDEIEKKVQKSIRNMDVKSMRSLLGRIKDTLELTIRQIASTNDQIEATKLISTDDSPEAQRMRPSYMKIMTQDEKSAKLNSLGRQLETLENNKDKYKEMKNELNKYINDENATSDKQNSKKGKKGKKLTQRQLTEQGQTYKDVYDKLNKDMGDNYDKKYLKYKAKYLALKKQYNL